MSADLGDALKQCFHQMDDMLEDEVLLELVTMFGLTVVGRASTTSCNSSGRSPILRTKRQVGTPRRTSSVRATTSAIPMTLERALGAGRGSPSPRQWLSSRDCSSSRKAYVRGS